MRTFLDAQRFGKRTPPTLDNMPNAKDRFDAVRHGMLRQLERCKVAFDADPSSEDFGFSLNSLVLSFVPIDAELKLESVQRAIEVGTVPFLLQVVRSFYDLVYPGVRRLVDSYYNGTRHMPDYARDIPNYLPRTRYINEALVALREIVYCDPWQCEGELGSTATLSMFFNLLCVDDLFEGIIHVMEEVGACRRQRICLADFEWFIPIVYRMTPPQLLMASRFFTTSCDDISRQALDSGDLRGLRDLRARRERNTRVKPIPEFTNQNMVLAVPYLLERLVSLMEVAPLCAVRNHTAAAERAAAQGEGGSGAAEASPAAQTPAPAAGKGAGAAGEASEAGSREEGEGGGPAHIRRILRRPPPPQMDPTQLARVARRLLPDAPDASNLPALRVLLGDPSQLDGFPLQARHVELTSARLVIFPDELRDALVRSTGFDVSCPADLIQCSQLPVHDSLLCEHAALRYSWLNLSRHTGQSEPRGNAHLVRRTGVPMRNVLQQLVENAEAVEEEEIREDASRLYRAMGAESPDAAFLALATRPMPYLYFGRLQVEALTLLATLLGGPRAAEVRNRLLDAGAQVVLAHAMRTVEWGSSREPLPPEHRLHGPGCECNADSNLKTMLIRVAQHFLHRMPVGELDFRALLSDPLIHRLEAIEGDIAAQHARAHGGGGASTRGARAFSRVTRGSLLLVPARGLPSQLERARRGNSMRLTRWGMSLEETRRMAVKESFRFTRPKRVRADLRPGRRPLRDRTQAAVASDRLLGPAAGPAVGTRPDAHRHLHPHRLPVLHAERGGARVCGHGYRNWAGAVVENMTRHASPAECVLVAEMQADGAGPTLLEHAIGNVLLAASEPNASDSIQCTFDMLGELVKFCRINLWRASRLLQQMDPGLETFTEVVRSSATDTNVFVRCVALTVEQIRREDESARAQGGATEPGPAPEEESEALSPVYPFPMAECRMVQWSEDLALPFLADILACTDPHNVYQSNLCCVNTAVGYFVLAWLRGDLAGFLERFREYEREHAEHGSLGRRARALLWFWQAFYSARSIEIENLEVGTGIRYEMWVKVVQLLSADDGSPTAILSSPIELPRFDSAHPFPPEPVE